ncbi:hypothetical protein M3Y98_00978000 [Aphelenchoides besseyi]|nr:hypothetical protein M3Y98_00978000 [Aphelenchoides besseyi]
MAAIDSTYKSTRAGLSIMKHQSTEFFMQICSGESSTIGALSLINRIQIERSFSAVNVRSKQFDGVEVSFISLDSNSSICSTTEGLDENPRRVIEQQDQPNGRRRVASSAQPATHVLPPFLANRLGPNAMVDVRDIVLSGSRPSDAENTNWTYTIRWYEDAVVHDTVHIRVGNSIKNATTPLTKCNHSNMSGVLVNGAGTDARNFSFSEAFGCRSPKTHSEVGVEMGDQSFDKPDLRRCDGPCGELRPARQLTVFGRCEHAVCAFCIASAGCPNRWCLANEVISYIPGKRRRHELRRHLMQKNGADEVLKLTTGSRTGSSESEDQSVYSGGLQRCDGPCGKLCLASELTLFGHCEHAVCAKCMASAGCPNRDCLVAEILDWSSERGPQLYRRYKKIQSVFNEKSECSSRTSSRSSSVSAASVPSVSSESFLCSSTPSGPRSRTTSDSSVSSASASAVHGVLLRAVILTSKDPMEKKVEEQMYIGEQSLRRCLIWFISKSCKGYSLDDARVYLADGDPFKGGRLFRIDMESDGRRPLLSWPLQKSVLFLVLDFAGHFDHVQVSSAAEMCKSSM